MMQVLSQMWREDARNRSALLLAGACVGALGVWMLWMWREWSQNPDLSHGFFAVPVLALLIREAGRVGGATLKLPRMGEAMVVAVLAVAVSALWFLATVYAVSLDWRSRPALFLLTAGIAILFGGAAWVASLRGWIGWNWPLAVALLVLVLSAPLPPGTYARLTLMLQDSITGGVLRALHWLGVPATRAGTVIQLSTTAVGVEEACSGVRSLISCVFAGLVISALMLRGWGRRLVLVLLAAGLALVTNFVRSLVLTLLASRGVDIAGPWHDWTGYGVLVVTAGLLMGIGVLLEENKSEATVVGRSERSAGNFGVIAAWVLLGTATVAGGWIGFVRAHWWTGKHAAVAEVRDVKTFLPPPPEGWRAEPDDDLSPFTATLLTDHLVQRTYHRVRGSEPVFLTVYIAYWPAGRTSVSTVASHTPEACWPGAGWELDPARSASRHSLAFATGGGAADAEYRFFKNREVPQNVWYWHLYDGKPIRPFNPRSWQELTGVFLRDGIRSDQAQMFVRLSSNLGWEQLSGEPLVQTILRRLGPVGIPVY